MKNVHEISIIGLGPRGINITERLLAILKEKAANRPTVILNIINDGELGCGVHKTEQPPSLLINTVASQITMYTDESVIGAGPISSGPSLFTWATNNGYKFDEESRAYVKYRGRDLSPNDYLPRSIFGEYLKEVASRVIDELRRYCEVRIHNNTATNIIKLEDNSFSITLDNNVSLISHYLFLTTGHSTNELNEREKEFIQLTEKLQTINKNFSFIANPYPIAKITVNCHPKMTVAIEGFGLTANDIISGLTIGKGGQFLKIDNTGHYRYIASGCEPKIVVYSTTGLPFSGRAINQKGVSRQYKPTFFTYQNTSSLKVEFGSGPNKQLDFEQHILPILIKEMKFCYYTTVLKDDIKLLEFSRKFIEKSNNDESVDELINQYFSTDNQFDWVKIMNPTLGMEFKSPEDYKSWMMNYLENDLAECLKGNIESPLKATCDLLRDVRDIMRSMIDFAGLTEDSHKQFMEKYVPVMNRISVGPPKERIAELLALVEEGIVDIFVGRNPLISINYVCAKFVINGKNINNNSSRIVDQIIKARIAVPIPELDQSQLMINLLKQGLVKPFYNENYHPSGIDIDKNFHPIAKNGQIETNMWAIGTVTEGAKYYTYIVPRTGVNSTGLVDAGKATLAMFINIASNEGSLTHEPIRINTLYRSISKGDLSFFNDNMGIDNHNVIQSNPTKKPSNGSCQNQNTETQYAQLNHTTF